MPNVMIIDDDVPMLRYLERVIDWQEVDCRIVATSQSAVTAMKRFAETMPDLVLTDIGLPQTDGIRLAAEFRKMKPDVRILFLTCHAEFDYAKQALELRADDYLIKDGLTPDQLKTSVEKAISNIRRLTDLSVQVSYREELERHKDVLKQTLLKQLKAGNGAELAVVTGKKLGMNWIHPDFIVGCGFMDIVSFADVYRHGDLQLIRYAWYNIAQDIVSAASEETVIQDEDGSLVFIWNVKRNLAINRFEEIQRLMLELRNKTKEYLKVDTYYRFARHSLPLAEIGEAWKRLSAEKSFYYEEPSTFSLRSVAEHGEVSLGLEHARILRKDREKLLAACDAEDVPEAEAIWRRAAEEAKESRMNPADWIADCSEALRMLEYHKEVGEDQEAFHAIMRLTRNWQETTSLAIRRMKAVIRGKGGSGHSREPKIKVIEQYILSHLSENVSSIAMANLLYLNPSYFSRYFKKATGVNFIDYAHELKMKVALQMLKNKEETVETVAMKLGYSDRTYFSKVFKKYNGFSPKAGNK